MTQLDELASYPNALAPNYSRFRVADRLLLSGHSHQAWPDVARAGQLDAFDDAALAVDDKWRRAFTKADRVRDGFRSFLRDPGCELALGANTHELLLRFLSALDLRGRARLVSTDGEFHTLRRQLGRLAEENIEVVSVATNPVATLAERLAAATDDRTSAVLVSAVLFETSRIVPRLGELAAECRRRGMELFVDSYHALGCTPFSVPELGLDSAWVVGGGYKYLQLGEGNCFLRIPTHAEHMRPVITGWFAEFDELAGDAHEALAYGPGASRFAGATYDPTSHYRAARVFDFFQHHDLHPEFFRRIYLHQLRILAEEFDTLDAPDTLITRDRTVPLECAGGFLALCTTRAAALHRQLAERGVTTDYRGEYLRFGPAPYLCDDQLRAAMDMLGQVLRLPEFRE